MKRFVICLLAIMIMIAPITAQGFSHSEKCWCTDHLNGTLPYIPGDTDRDGKVTATDALEILRCCVSRLPENVPLYNSGTICPSILVMDVNNNGIGDAEDALEVLKYVVGKVDGFARQPVYYQPESPTDAQ